MNATSPAGHGEGPWITTISYADATGTLREAYDWQAARLGSPTDFTRLGSLYPELVLQRLRLYKVVDSAPTGLSDQERHLAAYVVSKLNDTAHCASGLEIKLDELGVASERRRAVLEAAHAAVPRPGRSHGSGARDGDTHPRGAGSSAGDERLDAIVAYAAVLTIEPGSISEEHVERLRSAGLDDLDIVDLNNLVAYYNYINRVANGLGLRSPIPRDHALSAVPR